jgi:hypothetical protein
LKLIWFDGRFISDECVPPIPDRRFFFKDFGEILGRNWHPDDIHGRGLFPYNMFLLLKIGVYYKLKFVCFCLSDVIGVVHEVTFHQRVSSKLPMVMFVLKNVK